MPFVTGTFNRNYNFQNDQAGGIPAQAVRFDVELDDIATGLTFLYSKALTTAGANGSVPIGTGTGWTFATLTAGTNITITNAAGSITVASPNSLQTTGGTLTGLVTTVASATGTSGFRLPHGVAPTSPTNGDLWTTSTALFVRINGVTKQMASLSGTETFTAKTFGDTPVETVFTITDAAGFAIDPTNGSMQIITIGSNRTPVAANWANGQSVLLEVVGTANTLTWTDTSFGASGIKWVTSGNLAPTLATSGSTWLTFWKRGGQVFGTSPGTSA